MDEKNLARTLRFLKLPTVFYLLKAYVAFLIYLMIVTRFIVKSMHIEYIFYLLQLALVLYTNVVIVWF